jgi:hypothetical protein
VFERRSRYLVRAGDGRCEAAECILYGGSDFQIELARPVGTSPERIETTFYRLKEMRQLGRTRRT